jgi:hypothetical protein
MAAERPEALDFARRAARNEELVREVNRQIEEGTSLHEVTSSMPLHCECARPGCVEKIDVEPRTYQPILDQRYRFIVAHGHVQPEIERVVEEQEAFVVVEKIGEARKKIDADHPQSRHRRDTGDVAAT